MSSNAMRALCCAMLFVAATNAQVATDAIFGLKSCGSSPPTCGNHTSAVPVHLFSFRPDGSAFTDHGALTIDGRPVDADGLAISPAHGLLAFRLDRDAMGRVTGSVMISIDAANGRAYVRGPQLPREIRGAAFDANARLWALDTTASELLEVDPLTGLEMGTPTALNSGGRPFSLHDICDLAVDQQGAFHVTSRNEILHLDPATGDLATILTDTGHGNVGATFWPPDGAGILITFDVNYGDDLLRYDLSNPAAPPVLLAGGILPIYNAGRGDLASLRTDRVLGRCEFRNGTGLNAAGYWCTSPPALGTAWRSSVQVVVGTSRTFLAFGLAPDPGLPFFGSEILIGLTPPPVLDVAYGAHALILPNVSSMIGNRIPSQAFRIDAGPLGAPQLVVLNAQDLTLGW